LAKKLGKTWQQVPKDQITLDRLIWAFEVRNRTLNRSPRTTSWYSNNLRLFKNFLEAHDYSLAIGDIGIEVVREYILHLQTRNKYEDHPLTPAREERLTPSTIRDHVQTIKGFFSWLYEEGYTETNKLKILRDFRVPRKFVEVLSDEEIRKVLSSIDEDSPAGARNMAIIVTLLDTGLRVAELVNLKMRDAKIEQGYLKVMGKGSKERIVPIGTSTQRILLRYVLRYRPEPVRPEVDNLFLTAYRKAMTVNTVHLMLKRIGAIAGVRRLHAHLCRHTFATNYLLNGGDVFSLQQILGHSSLEMVRRYVTLASAQVSVQHRKFSPMDRMGLNGKGRNQVDGPRSGAR
jgi:site-specific recombinase XerD